MQKLLILCAFLACCGVAQADIIKLKNGGRIEGEILEQDRRTLRIKVKGGGKLTLSMKQVRYVRTRASSELAYAEQLSEVNFNDPMSIERLSLWASQQGLGDKAMDLMDMAQGLRLERMIARAKGQQRAGAYVDIYYWARSVGLSDTVLTWILGQGRALDPSDKSVKGAYARQRKDLAERAERKRRHAEIAKRPRYKMVSKILPVATVPTLAEMKSRIATERRVRRLNRTEGAAQRERTWLGHAREMRLAEAKRRAGIRQKKRDAHPADELEVLESAEVEEEVLESAEADD